MPEYLSPGVFIEEVDRGPRTIEGVSTSTAGLVGVTERGPANVPVLVTSFPEFRRWFGGLLRDVDFVAGTRPVWQLPYSVRGFFENGGRRAYVVRVTSGGAVRARADLFDQGSPTAFHSPLVSRTQAGDAVFVVADATGVGAGDTLRLDDAEATEYVEAGATAALGARGLGLVAAAYAGYDPAVDPADATIADAPAPDDFAGTLDGGVGAGATVVLLDSAPPTNDFAPDELLRIGNAGDALTEYVEIAAVPADRTDLSVQLRYPLAFAHPNGTPVTRVEETAAPALASVSRPVRSGDGLAILDAAPGGAVAVIRFTDPGTGRPSYHGVRAPAAVVVRHPIATDRGPNATAQLLDVADDAVTFSETLTQAVNGGDTVLPVSGTAGVAAGAWVRVAGPDERAHVAAVDGAAGTITLTLPLRADHANGAAVVIQTTAAEDTALLEAAPAGATRLLLADPTGTPAAAGQVLAFEIGQPGFDFTEIGSITTPDLVTLAAGTSVAFGHRAGTLAAARADLLSVEALDTGDWGNELRVTVSDEPRGVVDTTVAAAAPAMSDVELGSLTGIEPGTLVELIDFSTTVAAHAATGATVVELAAATAAINANDWLRVGRADPETVRVAAHGPGANQVTLATPLRRDHPVGEWVDRMSAAGTPRFAKVAERVGARHVRFDGGGLGFPVAAGETVRSREFSLTIDQVQDNPRRPGADLVVQSETHRGLTLDSRHPRYAGTVVGLNDGPLRPWDGRPEGQSLLVRIDDPLFPAGGPDGTQAAMRPGPDLVMAPVPGGRRAPVGRWLTGGDDALAGVTAASFQGQDHVDPAQRTGIQALRNIDDISIVAVPGQVDAAVQQELIDHCEREQYRFAVLDSVPGTAPTGATVTDVLAQRQQHDTRFAALYYPWVLIPHPFPQFPDDPGILAVPPSGHMLGVYAQTDNTDGVHKAPANEIVRGIVGFQRAVTKGEHEILNPGPVNVNVLRDFRSTFRGLRSFGARVITSDPAWKYVNVRRLFIFLERSLDIGLQWVTFEPNDENLWAAVRRTISDFLTAVWRSGALMGTTAEEAYFVKCDRTTMTQNDIDNGRLIVEVGVAPVKPAEFVIVRISQWSGGSAVEEA